MPQNIRYVGGASQRTLTSDDMLVLGVEDHPGLWWTERDPVVEVEDDVAEALLSGLVKREFASEATEEEQIEELVEEKNREDLITEAELLGLKVPSKATKEEIAELIVAEQVRLGEPGPSGATPPALVPDGSDGEQLEPHA